ncbi:hypothetical protein C0J52_04542 [Blattella germanica]|nr:hypothetical protein C0J52_04542 [Blattella germanica]
MQKLLNITEEENLLQTLLNVSDTWTSLRLVNGYMKETGLNDDLIHGSNDLWYQKESYSSNLCVKITKTNKLQTVQCTTQLPVVCEFETFYRNKSDTIEHKTANVVSSGKSSNEHVHSNDDNFAMTTNKNSSDSAKEEMASFHVRLSRMKRQNQQIDKCPPNYYLHNSYCVRETEKATWSNAYQDCFRNAIEKTPLDIEGNLENLNFINTLLEKLEKKGIKSIWLAAQRKIGGGPIVYSGPIDFKFNYDNHSTAQALNITWNKHINYNNNTVTNE